VVISPFEQSSLDLKPWLRPRASGSRTWICRNSPILDFACTGHFGGENCGAGCGVILRRSRYDGSRSKFSRISIPHENSWPPRSARAAEDSRSDFQARIEGVECTGMLPGAGVKNVSGERPRGYLRGRRDFIRIYHAIEELVSRISRGCTEGASRANRDPFFSLPVWN